MSDLSTRGIARQRRRMTADLSEPTPDMSRDDRDREVERLIFKTEEYIEAVITYLDPGNQFTHSRRRHVDRTGEELAEIVAGLRASGGTELRETALSVLRSWDAGDLDTNYDRIASAFDSLRLALARWTDEHGSPEGADRAIREAMDIP